MDMGILFWGVFFWGNGYGESVKMNVWRFGWMDFDVFFYWI